METPTITKVLCVSVSHWSALFCHSHSLPKSLAQGPKRQYEEPQWPTLLVCTGYSGFFRFCGYLELIQSGGPSLRKRIKHYKYEFRCRSEYLFKMVKDITENYWHLRDLSSFLLALCDNWPEMPTQRWISTWPPGPPGPLCTSSEATQRSQSI